MIKLAKYIIVLSCVISFIRCGSYEKSLLSFAEEKIVISYGTNSNKKFRFSSSDNKVICIGFLDRFNDTIVTLLNKKEKIIFNRKDSISYKKLKDEDVFKFILIKKNHNRITVLLKNSKKKTSFDIVKNKKMYLLSHFDDVWFLTIWD